MSIELVEEFSRGLPPRLREDILGYARSVQIALPEIFEKMQVSGKR